MKSFYFQTYDEWHKAITLHCRLELTKTYTEARLQALQNNEDPTTKEFLQTYGEDYRKQVIHWFERAHREAS
ncbi:MAG: hypothetical protein JJT75_06090 [Opitutales bacterium]|nr:hypothetical protein [Opitutales bacterium]MCH8540150.1 hypothetical protein [Opitutales bacterium]